MGVCIIFVVVVWFMVVGIINVCVYIVQVMGVVCMMVGMVKQFNVDYRDKIVYVFYEY